MVVALDGVEQDKTKNLYWMIYDEGTGQRIPVGMDIYQPVDMSTTLFKFEKVEGSCQEQKYKNEWLQQPNILSLPIAITNYSKLESLDFEGFFNAVCELIATS